MAIVGFFNLLGCSPKTAVFGILWLLEFGGLNLNPESAWWNNLWEGWLFQPLQNTPIGIPVVCLSGSSAEITHRGSKNHMNWLPTEYPGRPRCRLHWHPPDIPPIPRSTRPWPAWGIKQESKQDTQSLHELRLKIRRRSVFIFFRFDKQPIS